MLINLYTLVNKFLLDVFAIYMRATKLSMLVSKFEYIKNPQ